MPLAGGLTLTCHIEAVGAGTDARLSNGPGVAYLGHFLITNTRATRLTD